MFLWHRRNQELKTLALWNPLIAPGLKMADIDKNIEGFGVDMRNARVEGTETFKVYRHIVNDVLANAMEYEEKEFNNAKNALEKLRVKMISNSNVGMKAQNQMKKLRQDALESLEQIEQMKNLKNL